MQDRSERVRVEGFDGVRLCFEPMTAPANALASRDRLTLVPAGASYAAAFSIAVEAA